MSIETSLEELFPSVGSSFDALAIGFANKIVMQKRKAVFDASIRFIFHCFAFSRPDIDAFKGCDIRMAPYAVPG